MSKAATLGLSLLVLCGCAAAAGLTPVLNGALTALDAICETRDSAYLDLARDLLERGDTLAAIEQLKMFIITHGYDREVLALLNLLETQIPTALPQLPEVPNG